MRNRCKWVAAAVAIVAAGWIGSARGQSPTPQTLVFAAYDTPDGAQKAWNAMKQTARQGVISIDSYAVVSKDDRGRVHVHSTQKRGAVAGSVLGALLGVIGGPAGVAVGATAGGGLGYLTGNAVGIPQEDINAIKAALQPGNSAIVAVVDERWVGDLERGLHEAQAKQVLDHKIAGEQPAQPTTHP